MKIEVICILYFSWVALCVDIITLLDWISAAENYMLALCEGNRKKELLQLLEVVDVTKFSSVDCLASIFNILGKLTMESFAEKLFMALKVCGMFLSFPFRF